MKDTNSAFPVVGCKHYEDEPDMTLLQYAAIKLRVPRSGDPDIDAMIRESRRADFAEAVVTGAFMGRGFFQTNDRYKNHARAAFILADAMLAEWEKEEGA
jgi:hypothetical protein